MSYRCRRSRNDNEYEVCNEIPIQVPGLAEWPYRVARFQFAKECSTCNISHEDVIGIKDFHRRLAPK